MYKYINLDVDGVVFATGEQKMIGLDNIELIK